MRSARLCKATAPKWRCGLQSMMWDSALYRLEQRSDQRVGRFESSTTQAKWHNRLDRLQLFRWIHPQIDFGRADIRVAEPQFSSTRWGPETSVNAGRLHATIAPVPNAGSFEQPTRSFMGACGADWLRLRRSHFRPTKDPLRNTVMSNAIIKMGKVNQYGLDYYSC